MKVTLILLIVCSAAACTARSGERKRPNFLFIIADDQSPFDLKTYEPDSSLDTPNIDRLLKEMIRHDDPYRLWDQPPSNNK